MRYKMNGYSAYISTLLVIIPGLLVYFDRFPTDKYVLLTFGIACYYFGNITGIIKKNQQNKGV